MCSNSPKSDTPVSVLTNAAIAPGFHRMVVDLKGADRLFAPGQFFQIRINPHGNDPLLRRPFAPSEVFEDMMAFVYAVVGHGTQLLSDLHDGDPVSILAPLGRGYTLPEEVHAQAVLVGGGCGTPSLLPLARRLHQSGHTVHVAVGAQNACSLLEAEALHEVATRFEPATDDGSRGMKGHAVLAAEKLLDALDPEQPTRIYACGPHPMLRGLSHLAAERNLPCEVSLEERMGCGFGACVGCVVKVCDDQRPEGFVYKKVCVDGPVFDATDLIWD